jgi:hypothetical protein
LTALSKIYQTRFSSPQGYVYFVGSYITRTVKIGYARNPLSRCRDLATGSPVPLRLMALQYGTQADERALHRRFRHYRKHGEWFEYRDAVKAYIEERHLPEIIGFDGTKMEPPQYYEVMAALDRQSLPLSKPLPH